MRRSKMGRNGMTRFAVLAAAFSGAAFALGAGAAGACLRRTSVPPTGPRQVVPVYGIRSVVPLSSIVPVPLSEKLQLGRPGRVALPLAVIGTVVPFTS